MNKMNQLVINGTKSSLTGIAVSSYTGSDETDIFLVKNQLKVNFKCNTHFHFLAILLFCLFCLTFTSHAQNITNYTFASSSGTFTALTSPINPPGTSGTVDDGYFNNIPIGFDFWYMGTLYTSISASTNGWLTLGADITNSSLNNNLSTGGTPRPVIAPLWDDIDIQAANNVSYKITGSAPNRVFTIQYLNTQWLYNASGNTISFQTKLYESSGKIEFIYKPESGALVNPSASIGISATATGSGNFLSVNNAGTSVSSTIEANVTSKPASGKTYTFTSPVPTAPGNLTFTAVTLTDMTLNWVDNSNNESGFVIYKSTDGITYNYIGQYAANTTSSVQSGLTAGTLYYWKILAVSEGALSTALSGNRTTLSAIVTKTFTGTGNFSTAARWTGGTLPLASDNIIIDGACTVDNNAGTDNLAYGTMKIGTATGRTLNWIVGGTNRLNVSDVSAGAGSSALNMTNGGTLIIRSTWTSTNLAFTPGSGTIEIQSTITLPSAYSTFNNLILNGSDITVSLAAATTVNGTLTLSNGILVNAAYLTMANGATISRSQGSLFSAPVFSGTINLIYTGSSPVTTGHEAPVSTSVLNNLTTNSGGVVQGGTISAAVNILTEPFDNLSAWTGNIGSSNNQFTSVSTANAGGTANECRYNYGSVSGTNYSASIYRASVNTVGYTSVNISWKQFLNNYDPVVNPFTIKVQCAGSESGPWTDIYSLTPSTNEDIGPETKTCTNWTTNVGGTFFIRYFITGFTYGVDYWHIDDLVIDAQSSDSPSTLAVNGALNLSAGTYSIASNTLVLNGGLTGSNAIACSPASNLSVGGAVSNLTIPVITGGLNNFSVNRSAGVTLNGNTTVNGILNLQSGNPSATQGTLHLGENTLSMGALATTTGSGDVTGIVKRTSFIANIAYTFGNQFTTITFGAVGTLPSQIQAKISIGSAPAWKTTAIKRMYDFIQTGGSGCTAGIATHYLDTELNGNVENGLFQWTNGTPGPPLGLYEWGHSNFNSTDNWVSISNISIGSFPTSFGVLENTLAGSDVAAYTWNGSISNAWETNGNWTPSGIPSSYSNVIIPDATITSNDPVLPASASVKNLSVEAGGVLHSAAGAQLTVAGNTGAWNNSGTFNPNTSTVIFLDANATMAGSTNFHNVTVASGAALIPESGNTMRIAGALINNGILRAGYLHNTIEYNGANQTVINPNGATPGYYNLILSGSGTKTMPGTALSISGDFSMSGSASATAANAASVVGNVTLGAGNSLELGPYSYTVGGNVTNNGGTFSSSTSSITFNGSVPQTITSSAGVSLNNLTITNSSFHVTLGLSTNCSIAGNLSVNAGAVFDLAANNLTAVSGTVTNSGTIRTQSTSNMPVPAGKSWGGNFEFTGNEAQTIVEGIYTNLTMSGSGGATSAAGITVNGILSLTSVNPSAIKGILDMESYTLLMGPLSTTIGQGDVTGIIRRTTILSLTTYSFGNQYSNIYFPDEGTMPTEMSVKVSIGAAPAWKPDAVKRFYDVIQSGGSGTKGLIYCHYLDSELNGNTENLLIDWSHIFSYNYSFEYGRSAFNTVDNWVAISDIDMFLFNSSFGEMEIALGIPLITALTWDGSQNTDWFDAYNWTPPSAPSDNTAVTIPDAATTPNDPSLPTLATCGTISIESGGIVNAVTDAVLIINGAAGAWSNLGTFNPCNSTIVFKNINGTMTGLSDFYNLTTDAGSVLTLENNTYIGISGTLTNAGTIRTVVNGTTTVEYKGGDQTVVVPNRETNRYSTLILSGSGTKTMPATALNIAGDFYISGTATTTSAADMTFAGDLTIGNGTSFNAGNFYHSVAGDITNNGVFNAAAGNTFIINGASAQSITGTATTTFDNLTINNSNGVTLSVITNVNNLLALTSGNLTMAAIAFGMNGTISKTAGFLEVSPLTSLSFGGTGALTFPNGLFTSPPSIDNLTINKAGGVTLGNQSMTVNGLLNLSAGIFNLGTNTLTIAGSSPGRTSGSIDAGNTGATLAFTNTTAIILPTSVFTGSVNNLTITGVGGITVSSDFTVNGTLSLQSANPSATKGSIDMWDGSAATTLTMGEDATTIGIGDVTGIIKRTSFIANTPYTFGNQFTSLTFAEEGTYPSQILAKICIGTPPSWLTTAIDRIYEFVQTGGINCRATLSAHYLDEEFNGNTEDKLVFWSYGESPPLIGLIEFGRSNNNYEENWLSIANVPFSVFPSNFDVYQLTLANSALTSYTWNGSQSTSWVTTGNWTPSGIPSSIHEVIIPDASTTLYSPTLPTSTEIKSLTIQTGAVLNSASDTEFLINGDNGAWNDVGTFNGSTGTVIFTNASATISGITNFYNVVINSGAGLYVTSGNTMRIAGSMTNTGTWHAEIGDPTTVEYNGTDQIIVVPNPATSSYSNLILSGSGAKSLPTMGLTIYGDLQMAGTASAAISNAITVNGGLSIGNGTYLSVSSSATLSVSGTLVNNAGSAGFVLHSDASGTASLIHNSDNVPATVKRYIGGAAEAWHFLSSPAVSQEISGNWLPAGTYGNGTGYDLYLWNEPNNCWIYKLNTTSVINWNTVHPESNFIPGRGYLYSVQEANTLKSFVGNLNNGSLDILLTASSADPILQGFNLVGNPYPSSMDWQSFSGWTRSDLVSSGGGYDMWIWNPAANNYGVFNSATGIGTNSITGYIAPMQGYFVRASGTGTLGVNNNVRVHNDAGWFKNTEGDPVGISLVVKSETGNSSDEALLLFGYLVNEPSAVKLFSHVQTAPSLYLSSGNEKYSVQYLTDTVDYPSIPVLFEPGNDGNYTLSCNFDNDKFDIVTLEDKQMQYNQNMKAKKTYSFISARTDNENRFVLHFGVDNQYSNNELPARIYTFGTRLMVDLSVVGGETEAFVYDAIGRILLQKTLQGSTLHELNINSSTQILLVQLRNKQGNLCRKLFYKN